jgi:hypothetical protein
MPEQGVEESSENHRIRDIRHLKLVQAQYVGLIRKVSCDRQKRITCTGSLGGMHSLMDIKHERVEMHASLVGDACGECVVEEVHKHSLSCPNITVEI